MKRRKPSRSALDGTAPDRSGLYVRLGLKGLEYPIPEAAGRWPYFLGGVTAALVILLFGTGLVMAQFYQPTPAGARDSVIYLITRAPLGDWIRSIHYWSAGALCVCLIGHLGHVFWRRSYRAPREVAWWTGVVLAGVLFLLIITGTILRADEEGFEALAHFSGGGRLMRAFGGAFLTDAFTPSTPLLARIFALHTSLLPLMTGALIVLHFWLIRQIGINAEGGRPASFRSHAMRLAGIAFLVYATVGLFGAVAPEGIGYPPVPGMEVTKPFWPVLWIYGLENLLGMWGMVIGPLVVGVFLLALPLLDRSGDDRPGIRGPMGWVGLILGVMVLGFWLYGRLGVARAHLGM